jgi:hypothetical protein
MLNLIHTKFRIPLELIKDEFLKISFVLFGEDLDLATKKDNSLTRIVLNITLKKVVLGNIKPSIFPKMINCIIPKNIFLNKRRKSIDIDILEMPIPESSNEETNREHFQVFFQAINDKEYVGFNLPPLLKPLFKNSKI